MTIVAIREGIAKNLATITGLRSSWFMPDNPTPPIAVVVPQRVDFDRVMHRGLDTYTFDVIVVASRASERSGQSVLDGYCNPSGSTSIKAAIETDRTLSGAANDARVTDLSSYGQVTINETQYLAATFTVSVLA